MTSNTEDTPAPDELDKILDYIQVQMKKPVPSDIREEVAGVGDLIVKAEAKEGILNWHRAAQLQLVSELEGELDTLTHYVRSLFREGYPTATSADDRDMFVKEDLIALLEHKKQELEEQV